MDQAKIVEGSMRCHTLAWLSLIPLAGLILAPAALALHHRVTKETGQQWNPAAVQLRRGLWLSLGSLFYQVALAIVMITTDPSDYLVPASSGGG
jgi:uncharacterized membrane protein YccF (DUF307 family)